MNQRADERTVLRVRAAQRDDIEVEQYKRRCDRQRLEEGQPHQVKHLR